MGYSMTSDKRRLSNPLALAVLVLLYERAMHPYEMASTLRERRKEASIKLNYGSLYTVIEQLQRERFIVARETIRDGKRPEKTIYALTEEGRTELIDWMRELVSDPVKEFPQFEAALSLIPALPPDEVIELLEIRINLLRQILARVEEEERACEAMKLPRLFSIESEYHKEMVQAECKFCERLLVDIKHDADGLKSGWIELRKGIDRNRNTKIATDKAKRSRKYKSAVKG
jgi:DNA-binding PadR family transcriptional regulator